MTARFAIALCFIAWMPFSIFAQINPNNKNQYRFDDKWVDLEETTVKLKVKMGGIVLPIKKKAYWSKYGATVRTDKGTFSVRYGASQDIRGMEQWYRMDKSRNFSEFYKAMEMVAIPMFNTVYADRYDTIFYVSNAKIPIRAKGYDWKNTVIGNTSKTLTTPQSQNMRATMSEGDHEGCPHEYSTIWDSRGSPHTPSVFRSFFAAFCCFCYSVRNLFFPFVLMMAGKMNIPT